MNNVNDVVITDELRGQYAERYIRDDRTIRAVEYIKALSDERLEKMFEQKQNRLMWVDAEIDQLIRELCPEAQPISPRWVIGKVGEEMYVRDLMDEDDWLDLQDRTC